MRELARLGAAGGKAPWIQQQRRTRGARLSTHASSLVATTGGRPRRPPPPPPPAAAAAATSAWRRRCSAQSSGVQQRDSGTSGSCARDQAGGRAGGPAGAACQGASTGTPTCNRLPSLPSDLRQTGLLTSWRVGPAVASWGSARRNACLPSRKRGAPAGAVSAGAACCPPCCCCCCGPSWAGPLVPLGVAASSSAAAAAGCRPLAPSGGTRRRLQIAHWQLGWCTEV